VNGETGRCKSAWIQASNGLFSLIGLSKAGQSSLTNLAKEAYPHTSQLFVKDRCIYDTLTRFYYDEDEELFPWVKQGPPVRVREFSYDHLKQLVRIKEQQRPKKKPPKIMSFAFNFKTLGGGRFEYLFRADQRRQLPATAMCLIPVCNVPAIR
jgi:hypothetical protein